MPHKPISRLDIVFSIFVLSFSIFVAFELFKYYANAPDIEGFRFHNFCPVEAKVNEYLLEFDGEDPDNPHAVAERERYESSWLQRLLYSGELKKERCFGKLGESAEVVDEGSVEALSVRVVVQYRAGKPPRVDKSLLEAFERTSVILVDDLGLSNIPRLVEGCDILVFILSSTEKLPALPLSLGEFLFEKARKVGLQGSEKLVFGNVETLFVAILARDAMASLDVELVDLRPTHEAFWTKEGSGTSNEALLLREDASPKVNMLGFGDVLLGEIHAFVTYWNRPDRRKSIPRRIHQVSAFSVDRKTRAECKERYEMCGWEYRSWTLSEIRHLAKQYRGVSPTLSLSVNLALSRIAKKSTRAEVGSLDEELVGLFLVYHSGGVFVHSSLTCVKTLERWRWISRLLDCESLVSCDSEGLRPYVFGATDSSAVIFRLMRKVSNELLVGHPLDWVWDSAAYCAFDFSLVEPLKAFHLDPDTPVRKYELAARSGSYFIDSSAS